MVVYGISRRLVNRLDAREVVIVYPEVYHESDEE